MVKEFEEIAKGLEIEINKHGHAFQYAVIARANLLFDGRQSPWKFPVPEFPVEVQGAAGQIDVILQHKESPLFLIVEVKRTNPALSNWCFLKAPYPNDSDSRTLAAEEIHLQDPGRFSTSIKTISSGQDIYHLAYEVKSSAKGDSYSSGRGGIERAATQVLRGLNGVIQFLSTNPQILKIQGSMTFIPVIVTTARLFVSDVDLSKTDLKSGEVNLESGSISKRDWLFYNYPQSPGLKHSVQSLPKAVDFHTIMKNEYVRSIGIVSQMGLDDFLINEMWK